MDSWSQMMADHTLIPGFSTFCIILAVLISSFIGTEYSDRTVRNKVIAGHSRVSIYLANLITCAAAALAVYLTAMLIGGVVMGGIMMGGFELPVKTLLPLALYHLAAAVALSALFLMIAMMIQNRTGAAVVTILLALVMLIVPGVLADMLAEPEMIYEPGTFDALGNYIESTQLINNPYYISGAMRQLCEFVLRLLPTGQTYLMNAFDIPKYALTFPGYSLLLVILSTGIGMCYFRKKDIV